MPIFRFDKALGIARDVKAFLNPQGSIARGARPDTKQRRDRAEDLKNRTSEHKKRLRSEIKGKRRELSGIQKELRAAEKWAEKSEHIKKAKKKKLEIYWLKNELRAAAEGAPDGRLPPRAEGESETGALPDFVVIGAAKSGTTYFYHLLTQHPLVEPAAFKELQFFNVLFEEGIEWYRRCFPRPRFKDGRRTITGEATPYLFHPYAAERMAGVVPQARLIVLLRNPVDRAYSHYRMVVSNGGETLSFEEAIKAEGARLRGERDKMLRDKSYFSRDYVRLSYLSTGVYVDQLLHWSTFFAKEQTLVLKSEDFFERPHETLKTVLEFLGLPDWKPEAPEFLDERDKHKYDRKKRNKGRYEQEMDPATRRRLEEFFEPHNRRLYEYLGTDFGW